MFHFETFSGERKGSNGIVTLPVALARPPRRWKLRNPRSDGGAPLSAAERRISPDADLITLITSVIQTALEDLDAGMIDDGAGGTANERLWRAQAYLWFFHGQPTGFERFTRRLGIDAAGRLPPHALLDSAAALECRRGDLARLGLPPDLFDRRIEALKASSGIDAGLGGRMTA